MVPQMVHLQDVVKLHTFASNASFSVNIMDSRHIRRQIDDGTSSDIGEAVVSTVRVRPLRLFATFPAGFGGSMGLFTVKCSAFCPQNRRGTAPSENPAQDAERHKEERTQAPGSQGAERIRTPILTQTRH